MRLFMAAVMALTIILPPSTIVVSAAGGDRSIYLHHTHTGETGRFTFKRNGQYDQQVLKQLNIFLADWRTKEPTKMDPALFDLLWSVYDEVDATQPINIVSSYRSPKTNKMLRARSSGVAENSQHMRGKAMDFFIPGINLSRLRAVAMQHQVGGVGYYPTSGSPFVHLDTGNVRAWPRMTRAQLKKVFPDGKTLHIPTDGKVLSNDGRAYAQAQWTKCHAVPCNGQITAFDAGPDIMLADNAGGGAAPVPAMKPRDLYGDSAEILMASLEDPAQRSVSTIAISAPLPLARPETLGIASLDAVAADAGLTALAALGAPIPAAKSPRIQLATRSPLGTDTGETALAALAAIEDPSLPKPRVLMTPKTGEMVTAYVSTEADPGAELALKMIIERETAAALPQLSATAAADAVQHTASLGSPDTLGTLKGMFDLTFNALTKTTTPKPMADALADLALSRQPSQSIEPRSFDLVAPELDHVNETLVHPVMMTEAHWAEMTEAEGYLDKGTELGPMTGRIDFTAADGAIAAYDHFVSVAPQLVAEYRG